MTLKSSIEAHLKLFENANDDYSGRINPAFIATPAKNRRFAGFCLAEYR